MLLYNTFRVFDICAAVSVLGILYSVIRRYLTRSHTTSGLPGPVRTNWIWGINRQIIEGISGDFFDGWQAQFGNVYRVPTALGGERIVFMDPRAVAYVLSGNAYNFKKQEGLRNLFKNTVGDGILSAEGDTHKRYHSSSHALVRLPTTIHDRYRRAMSPGFAPAAIRAFTGIFLEVANNVKEEWTRLFEERKGSEVILNIEDWANRVALDSIGLAGFSHKFDCVRGGTPRVKLVFDTLGKLGSRRSSKMILGLLQAAPWILKLPFKRNTTIADLHAASGEVARNLLRDRKSEDQEASEHVRSIILALMKAENRTMTEEEVIAQLNTLLLAGYETSSTTIVWAIHELSLHPEAQSKLRSELRAHPQPTHEQLSSIMPYLDSVLKETLRLHAPFPEHNRVAIMHDTVPLGTPIRKTNGDLVDHIEVAPGMGILIPSDGVNRSHAIWGADATQFRPERWTAELPPIAEEVHGYHHILSFGDGPKNCIGRNFAVAEIKAVLSVLVSSFMFSPLNDGTDVKRVRAFGAVRGRNSNSDGLLIRAQSVECQ